VCRSPNRRIRMRRPGDTASVQYAHRRWSRGASPFLVVHMQSSALHGRYRRALDPHLRRNDHRTSLHFDRRSLCQVRHPFPFIIIIIINEIYIVQIRKSQQMCYQQLNRKVFNCFLNTSREMSGDRSSAGKLFQTTGPCTAKLRLP